MHRCRHGGNADQAVEKISAAFGLKPIVKLN